MMAVDCHTQPLLIPPTSHDGTTLAIGNSCPCRGRTDPTLLRCNIPELVKRCDEKERRLSPHQFVPVHDGNVQPRKEANSLAGSHGIFHSIQLHGGSTMID